LFRFPTPSSFLRVGVAVVALVVLTAVHVSTGEAKEQATTATPASSKLCSKQVIADWYDDGRVGKIYPLHCYRDAIESLPPDVLDYSSAKEEIGRALAFAKQGKPDPGGQDPTPTTSTGSTKAETTKTGTTKTGTTKTGTETTETTPTGTETTETVDTSAPSSVPVPLLVLGGLAVVLLAAGGAGYLRRRMGDNGDGGSDDPSPPASP
jgi:cobalamin biosynthesis Mg chelatase CobN